MLIFTLVLALQFGDFYMVPSNIRGRAGGAGVGLFQKALNWVSGALAERELARRQQSARTDPRLQPRKSQVIGFEVYADEYGNLYRQVLDFGYGDSPGEIIFDSERR